MRFSRLFFAGSILAVLLSPLYPNSLSIFWQVNVPKIALFAHGLSPYTQNPWAAPYPPLFFVIWSIPYLFLLSIAPSFVLSGLRIVSACVVLLTGLVIYRALSRNYSLEFSLCSTAVFLSASSVVNLLSLNGDTIGLLLVALASYCFALQRKSAILVGVCLAAFAVSFKIHPILGALIVLAAGWWAFDNKSPFFEMVSTSALVLVGFFGIPLLIIPSAIQTVLSYNGATVQYFSFSIYSGFLAVVSNIASVQFIASVNSTINVAWICVAIGAIVITFYAIARRKSTIVSGMMLDFLALGSLIWLIVLKQLLQHYFIWALIPLLVAGRWKSALLLTIGEVCGATLWGLGLLNSDYLLRSNHVPNLGSAILFLTGGILFTLFDLAAIRELARNIFAREREPVVLPKLAG